MNFSCNYNPHRRTRLVFKPCWGLQRGTATHSRYMPGISPSLPGQPGVSFLPWVLLSNIPPSADLLLSPNLTTYAQLD